MTDAYRLLPACLSKDQGVYLFIYYLFIVSGVCAFLHVYITSAKYLLKSFIHYVANNIAPTPGLASGSGLLQMSGPINIAQAPLTPDISAR